MGRGEAEQSGEGAARPRRRTGHRRFWASLGLAILLVVCALVGLGLSGRAIPLPSMLVERIEARANRDLAGRARLLIGSGDLVVSDNFVPQVRLGRVTLLSANGQRLAAIEDLRTALDGPALLSGRIVPAHIRISGARIAVRRLPDGSLDIAQGAQGFSGTAADPSQILDAIDAAFDQPNLSKLADITIEGLALLWDDRRAGQVWTIRDGVLRIEPTQDRLRAELTFAVEGQSVSSAPNGAGGPPSERAPGPARAKVGLELVSDKRSSKADLTVDLKGVASRDVAGQIPALAWLGALDAPLSGRVQSGLDGEGALAPIEVMLDVGAGALQPTPGTRPVPFQGADLRLAYDPARATLALTDLSIESAVFRARLTGKAWLKGMEEGLPEAMVAQVRLTDLKADPEGLFSDPVTISDGAMDLKLTLDPFELRIGQIALADRGRKIVGHGRVAAAPEGWSVAFDVGIDRIETARLLALWPLAAVPKTRTWVAENVATGELIDMKAAFRLDPDQPPRFGLDYRFREAQVRFMRNLPPVEEASGYATIYNDAYVMVTETGRIRAPKGGDLDIAGSVLKVPDIRQKPAPIEITLRSESSITAALAILDQKPFNFLTKAGQPVTLAEGRARLKTDLAFTPKQKLAPGDVRFAVEGELGPVKSAVLVKGRTLASDRLEVTADNGSIRIGGPATLDGVPLNARWTQVLGPEGKGRSEVAGTVELSPATLDAFKIALPDGAVAGLGEGAFRLALVRGQPPAFDLTSDLAGLRLQIPEVAWVKPEAGKGKLRITGRFAQPAEVEAIEIAADGLAAKGRLSLKGDGSLDVVEFPEVTLDDWFRGAVRITGQGKGKPAAVAITGGEADLRRASFGSGASGGGERPPLEVSLERLRISEGIALSPFNGRFSATGAGLGGVFNGLVNGAAGVSGELTPDPNGRAAFRILSDDAGRTLAAAGLYGSGRGGSMDLILRPLEGKGEYQGNITIRAIRVVNAPGLASLLNSISVVGLFNELQGAGIVFSNVEGQFRLTPAAVEITQGSAVGPSLGVSLAGVYWSGEERFDLQGVISPVYILNGIGQIFSRQRDGLFGFNYTLRGRRDSFKVAVNPLSILTPGMFREIFRQAPPKIAPEGGQ